MDKLIAERGTIRNEFSNLSQNDDVTSKLLNNTRNEEEIFSEELKKNIHLYKLDCKVVFRNNLHY